MDGPENGPPPPPWSIPCNPKALFKDDKFKLEVPHTAKVKVVTLICTHWKNMSSTLANRRVNFRPNIL